MQKISSRKTFFYKKVFPIFWFGILALVAAVMFIAPEKPPPVPLPVFFIPIVMTLFGYFLMRKLVFDLMDEVYDDGNRLVVMKDGAEDAIMLSNIINVGHSIAVNPARIVLTLRDPCRFGKKVAFCPKVTWNDFKSLGFINALAEDLVARADAARRST